MKKVIVFGSYITDLSTRCSALPIAGQTVLGNSFSIGPGGKGSNQAIAAHRAGADVKLITKIGPDMFGSMAQEFYKKEGLNIDYVFKDESVGTGTAVIIVETTSAQNEIIIVPGACENFTPDDVKTACEAVEPNAIMLTQLETQFEATKQVISCAKSKDCTVVLNPAPARQLPDELLQDVDILTPNESETLELTGIDVSDADPKKLEKACEVFLEKGVKNIIITLGKRGVYATDGKTARSLPAIDFAAVIDTTGAGDAFNGGLVAALSKGYDFFRAVEYGSVVSGLSVTRLGTAPSMPYKQEIERELKRLNF